jgi:hypothetical protein
MAICTYGNRQLLLVLVPMIVYIAKRLIVLVPKFAKKSPFLNAHGAILAVSFSLQTSTMMAIRAFGKDYIVYIAKRLVIFAPNFAKKSPFLDAQSAAPFFALSIRA